MQENFLFTREDVASCTAASKSFDEQHGQLDADVRQKYVAWNIADQLKDDQARSRAVVLQVFSYLGILRDIEGLVARIVLVAAETRVEDAHAEVEPCVETRACQGERSTDVDG